MLGLIVQAPMAGVATPALAAAVTNAGGLGSISVGALRPSAAAETLADLRARTTGAFNVNVFCHAPARAHAAREAAWIEHLRPAFAQFGAAPPSRLTEIYRSFLDDPEMLAVLVAAAPRVVSCHFGLPTAAAIRALRGAGCTLWASATNLQEARAAVAAGIDVIVAQGFEAGGHRGVFDEHAPDDELSTHALVRLLAVELRVPIVAAGGIMTGAEITAALSAGATAAQLGTAFVACPETAIDAGFRRVITSPAAAHTVMTRAMSGRPARCIANRLTALGEGVDASVIPAYPIAYDAAKALHAVAREHGDFSYGAQLAGTGAARIRAMPAADLVATLRAEMR